MYTAQPVAPADIKLVTTAAINAFCELSFKYLSMIAPHFRRRGGSAFGVGVALDLIPARFRAFRAASHNAHVLSVPRANSTRFEASETRAVHCGSAFDPLFTKVSLATSSARVSLVLFCERPNKPAATAAI